MEFTKEEQAALIYGAGGRAEGIWITNPHGIVVACPLEVYDYRDARGNSVGRKYDYGYRLATKEEIDSEADATKAAHKKVADKDIVITKIINDEPVAGESQEFSYAELKKLAKEKDIKVFGKSKEVLKEELGLV